MKESTARGEMHLALLINDEEWTTRSIESILKPEGYAVLMAYTGRQGYELASRVDADLLLVDLNLPDISGIDLCARLRQLPAVRPSVPVLLFTSGPVTRAQRLEAYRCGAWDVLQPPFDPQELIARLGPYVRAKRDVDHAIQGADVDPQTGCYNARGLMRRLKELGAEAKRSQRPLACVVLGPSSADAPVVEAATGRGQSTPSESGEFMRRLGDALHSLTRASDAVARMAQTDFVVLAPGTDREGADRLIERVRETMSRAGTPAGSLRAGVCTVSGAEADTPAAEEFLRRATSALREVQIQGSWDPGNQLGAGAN